MTSGPPPPPREVRGCKYTDAANYDQHATVDDGSCRFFAAEYEIISDTNFNKGKLMDGTYMLTSHKCNGRPTYQRQKGQGDGATRVLYQPKGSDTTMWHIGDDFTCTDNCFAYSGSCSAITPDEPRCMPSDVSGWVESTGPDGHVWQPDDIKIVAIGGCSSLGGGH